MSDIERVSKLVGCVAVTEFGNLWAVHGPSVWPGEVLVESLQEDWPVMSFPVAVVAGWARVA